MPRKLKNYLVKYNPRLVLHISAKNKAEAEQLFWYEYDLAFNLYEDKWSPEVIELVRVKKAK